MNKKNLSNLSVWFLIPFIIPVVLVIIIILLPFKLLGMFLAKGTIDEFNSPLKELWFGKDIAKAIEDLKRHGFKVEENVKGKETKYKIVTKNYDLRIEVDTDWVGFEFSSLKGSKRYMQYFRDTDLYPISQPQYREDGEEVEKETVEFLRGLKNKKVLSGEIDGYPALIFPRNGDYFIWQEDSFRTLKGSYTSTVEEAKKMGNFKVLT